MTALTEKYTKQTNTFLFISGLVLLLAEVYKQLFLYFIINNQTYVWWFFPWQLCSMPMYLCLIIPWLHSGKIRTSLLTFLRDYGFLGGVCALLISEGFRHIHWSLTLHGYMWHILLVAISLFLTFHGDCEYDYNCNKKSVFTSFMNTLPVLFICCMIATIINISAHNFGYIDMFYITPYYPSEQPIASSIALRYGIAVGHAAYLACMIIGAWIVHLILSHISISNHNRQKRVN